MMTNTDAFNVAAKWWADQLRKSEPPPRNAGWPSNSRDDILMIGALASTAKTPEFSEGQIDAFETALRERIATQFETRKESRPDDPCVVLIVDYDPCDLLDEAGGQVGIATLKPYLPIKTRMIIREHEVTLKEGYRADVVTIWDDTE
jgi:hypothetical protein